MAEILGPKALERTTVPGCSNSAVRGEELQHYHQNGVDIIALVHGVNAFIDQVMENPDDLPLPFKLLGIGANWTEEVVISRHQGRWAISVWK